MIPAELYNKIFSGEAVLFLGAGVSKSSGGPVGSELAEYIESKLCSYIDTSDLSIYTQALMKNRIATRMEIENYIKDRLDKLNPSKGLLNLTHLPWKSIYTVNFDELVEQSYRLSKSRYDLKIVNRENMYEDKESNQVCLYKINGSIGDVFSEDRPLLISYDDLLNKNSFRSDMLRRLTASLHDTVVFVGYSFSDNVIEDILKEFKTSNNYASIKQKYLIAPKQSAKEISKFDTIYDCKCIDCCADDFFNNCRDKFEKDYKAQLEAFGKSLSFFNGDNQVKFPPSVKAAINSYFEYYDENENYPNDPGFFYRCGYPMFGNIVNNLDVSRNILTNDNEAINSSELPQLIYNNLNDAKFSVYKVTGPIAVGKSTICYRLAFELYHKGVLTLFTNRSESLRKNLLSEMYNHLKKPFVIIVDDAINYISKINAIVDECETHNIPVTLMLSVRENDWELLTDKHFRRKIEGNITTFKIEDRLDEQQCIELAYKLINLKIIKESPEYSIKDLIEEFKKEKNIVASLMTSIEKTGFEKKFLIDFDRLSANTQNAYGMISLINRLCLPIKWELLQRSLQSAYSIDWNDFIRDIVRIEAKGNIIEYGNLGDYYYTCRHNYVAEVITKAFFHSIDDELCCYKIIIRNINKGTTEELFLGKVIQYLISHQAELQYTDNHVMDIINESLKSVLNEHYLLHVKGQFLSEKLKDYQGALDCFNKCIRDGLNIEYALHSAGMAHYYLATSSTGVHEKAYEIKLAKDSFRKGMAENPRNNFFYFSFLQVIKYEFNNNTNNDYLLNEAKDVYAQYKAKSTPDSGIEDIYAMITPADPHLM